MKNFMLILMLPLFVTIGCKKEDALNKYQEQFKMEEGNQLIDNPSSVSFRSGGRCLSPYIELFSEHFEKYRGTDPKIYFPKKFYGAFTSKLEEENQKMQKMGFEPYLESLQKYAKISPETKNLLLFIHNSVNVQKDVTIDALKSKLIANYNPAIVGVDDPFYCYVYNIALEIYNNYYGGHNGNTAGLRGDCEFKDFVQHVIGAAGNGAAIGTTIGSLIQAGDTTSFFIVRILGITISVGGAIIGGAIGSIVGIFTFNDGVCQNCNPVVTVVTTSDDNCDLTRTLRAIGAGPDALAFEWRVTQGETTVTITTAEPLLTVTQIDNNEPVGISVASLCVPDGETDISNAQLTPFTETTDIDLSTDASSLLGQPGDIEIIVINGGFGGTGQSPITSNVGLLTTFLWQNSNQGSGHIEHTVSIIPPNLGNIIQIINDNTVKVQWAESGSGSLRITAVNTCSGLSSYSSIPVKIN